MYNSPIELLVDEITHQIVKQKDENIYQAVLSYIPNVDKEELLRALQYDRNQYEKGYMDGKDAAMAELVWCKDCKHRGVGWGGGEYICRNPNYGMASGVDLKDDDFCSYGERKDYE